MTNTNRRRNGRNRGGGNTGNGAGNNISGAGAGGGDGQRGGASGNNRRPRQNDGYVDISWYEGSESMVFNSNQRGRIIGNYVQDRPPQGPSHANRNGNRHGLGYGNGGSHAGFHGPALQPFTHYVDPRNNQRPQRPRNTSRQSQSTQKQHPLAAKAGPARDNVELKWSVGLADVDPADEDSDTVAVDPTEDMLDENEDFLPTFLARDLEDPLKENQTKTLGLAALGRLDVGPDLNDFDSGSSDSVPDSDSDFDGTDSEDAGPSNALGGVSLSVGENELPFGTDGSPPAANLSGTEPSKQPNGTTELSSQSDASCSQGASTLTPPENTDGGGLTAGARGKETSSSTPSESTHISGSSKRSKGRKRNRKKKVDPDMLTWDDLRPIHDEIAAGLAVDACPSGEDFDAADFSRPSLGNQFVSVPIRNRPAAFQRIELSDEELQEKLEAAWDQNADMKKRRKAARQDVRAAFAEKISETRPISMAYPVAKSRIETDITDFIMSEDRELILPFMQKFQRVIVHRIAMRAGLHTESTGKEPRRFTILTKSSNNPRKYESRQQAFLAMQLNPNKSSRGSRNGNYGGYNGSGGRSGGKGKGAMAATRYKNGDVVGADAEPISETSKGHALLLKLGWEKGKPLGSSGAGILEPIEQVVKLSRTGLG